MRNRNKPVWSMAHELIKHFDKYGFDDLECTIYALIIVKLNESCTHWANLTVYLQNKPTKKHPLWTCHILVKLTTFLTKGTTEDQLQYKD